MKMDIGSSQSWWWESHNRPKHSKWLQENLGDVEANVQAMLVLIEGDADSFAQRAEMYYKKRPDLLKVVEQFYRGYRALAERYDQLTGSIRQIPSTIQSQYGLVSESPRSSPFAKQKKQGSDIIKETSSTLFTDSNSETGECDGNGDHFDISSVDEKSVEQSQDGEESSSSSSCSDGEADGASLAIQKLQEALERSQAENKRLSEKAREKLQQHRETEKRLHGFREDFLRVQKENNTLKAELEKLTKKLEGEVQELCAEKETLQHNLRELEEKYSSLDEKSSLTSSSMQKEIAFLQEENGKLQVLMEEQEEKQRELTAGLRFMKGTATSLLAKNKALIEQVFSLAENDEAKEHALVEQRNEASNLSDEIQRLKSLAEDREWTVSSLNSKVAEMNRQVSELEMENQRQRDAIADSAEEKREAIRQLCFSIDLLNNRNQWLEELVLSAKAKINDYNDKLALRSARRGCFTS
ncbi:protein NETWORKED 4B [Selaginella moellendorffii]|uniref:protein NETWORKED 4B n=1 Tax=Selaginella moellendorffii TaxID=88036 RepID=UPI000D1CEFBC|nr:protein NETWORKED 4B [Selaginella moellendorffii]|eukprot:XP_024535692.1 protein NETWORKED 4B [Selaginella moellendorffii]